MKNEEKLYVYILVGIRNFLEIYRIASLILTIGVNSTEQKTKFEKRLNYSPIILIIASKFLSSKYRLY